MISTSTSLLAWNLNEGFTWVEVTAIPVAIAFVPVTFTTTAGSIASAGDIDRLTDMWGYGIGDAVSFPDVHLIATRA